MVSIMINQLQAGPDADRVQILERSTLDIHLTLLRYSVLPYSRVLANLIRAIYDCWYFRLVFGASLVDSIRQNTLSYRAGSARQPTPPMALAILNLQVCLRSRFARAAPVARHSRTHRLQKKPTWPPRKVRTKPPWPRTAPVEFSDLNSTATVLGGKCNRTRLSDV